MDIYDAEFFDESNDSEAARRESFEADSFEAAQEIAAGKMLAHEKRVDVVKRGSLSGGFKLDHTPLS